MATLTTRGGEGPVIRQPFDGIARPGDYGDPKRSRSEGRTRNSRRASPVTGARTGPVRGHRSHRGQPMASGNIVKTSRGKRRSGRHHRRK